MNNVGSMNNIHNIGNDHIITSPTRSRPDHFQWSCSPLLCEFDRCPYQLQPDQCDQCEDQMPSPSQQTSHQI